MSNNILLLLTSSLYAGKNFETPSWKYGRKTKKNMRNTTFTVEQKKKYKKIYLFTLQKKKTKKQQFKKEIKCIYVKIKIWVVFYYFFFCTLFWHCRVTHNIHLLYQTHYHARFHVIYNLNGVRYDIFKTLTQWNFCRLIENSQFNAYVIRNRIYFQSNIYFELNTIYVMKMSNDFYFFFYNWISFFFGGGEERSPEDVANSPMYSKDI